MNETVKPEAEEVKEPAEAESKQDDLDTLLNEWDSPEGKQAEPEKKPEQPPADNSDPRLDYLYNAAVSREIDDTVDRLMEGVAGDIEIDREAARDWLEGRASRDQRVARAFLGRSTNPSSWQKTQAALAKDFASRFKVKSKDEDNSPDKEAAAAYVRGSSTKETPAKQVTEKDLAKMSDAEFRRFEQELLEG